MTRARGRRRRHWEVVAGIAALLVAVAVAWLALRFADPEPGVPSPPERATEPTGPPESAEPPRTGPPPRDYLVVSHEELMALPTSGRSWSALKEVADSEPGSVDLEDQENTHAGQLLAAALVYARTGEERYKDAVEDELRDLPEDDLDDARALSVARQLAGYVIAADLVGYRDPDFVDFVSEIRTRELDGHDRWTDLTVTSEDTASNWGAWALASRIAASLFVGDRADVEESARIFRGFTGDSAAYADWRKTDAFDPSYTCEPEDWVPINPTSCGELGGAIVEDISRSRGPYPDINGNGLTYSWETLGGATLSAELLSHAGHPDVWSWGDNALLRAAEFLEEHGGYPPRYSINQYIPWAINRAYGVRLGPVEPLAGFGRQYGYTDWLP